MKFKLALAFSLLCTAILVAQTAERVSNGQQAAAPMSDDSAPVADFNAPGPKNGAERTKREAKGKRYDRSGLVVEPGAPGGDIVRRSNSFRNMPALPVGQSEAVIIGEVTGAQAHLSNDRSGVYTEFAVRVEEVLKHGGSLAPGASLTAERVGGRVRFASGRVQRYGIDQQGLPKAGRRYVLFLSRAGDGESYYILTGYELRGGRVHPFDGVKTSAGGGELPQFAAYKDADEASFLAALREAISRS